MVGLGDATDQRCIRLFGLSVADDQLALDTALAELEGRLEPESGCINGQRLNIQQIGEAPGASAAADDEEVDSDATDIDPAADSDDDEPGNEASVPTGRTRSPAPAFERRPIVVGFARGGVP